MIIVLGYTSEEAWSVFDNTKIDFKPFRDALSGECSYECTIQHCLMGLEYAMKLGWYDYENFNIKKYEFYEQVDNGDFNWIVPGKFMAFSGPSRDPYDEDGYPSFTPEKYVPIFKKHDINLVVRLNYYKYDENEFTKEGINFLDIPFKDGTPPPEDEAQKFLEAAEEEKGAIAVHCKAGLGRTGTIIGIYCIKHYGFPAAAYIGWSRICRPGSVLGPQQHYLIEVEEQLMKSGGTTGKYTELTSQLNQMTLEESKHGSMSPSDLKIKKFGDQDQADRLIKQKRKGQTSKKP